ncbi:urea transport protein [Colletotrichum musicola]|uniref:Urea transport protein n=1 Tax=Colletotrichum musicola TaxID=2175873 RepID=A0A8H6NER0_9PEZI|nr:urea transport protein [Colletotrichum musicola]
MNPLSMMNPSVVDRLTYLPVELQHQVLYELLISSPACAFALFVPDWGVCAHGADPVNRIYDLQRTDVYTRSSEDDDARGTLVSGVPHDENDHLLFSSPGDAHAACGLVEQLAAKFPAALEWALRDVERERLHVFQQTWPRAPDDVVGKYMSTGALVFNQVTRRGYDGLGEPPRHLMFNGAPRDPWPQLRRRGDRATRDAYEMRLVVDSGGEMLELDWAAMTQLESVFLDLRAYGRGEMEEEGIRRGAARMGCLRLCRLVVAGLRSSTGAPRQEVESCDWERDDREPGGGVNWVKVFCGAVRQGGRLVFVDRRMLDVDWDAWRTRAEEGGLLPRAGDHGQGKYLRHVGKAFGSGSKA